MKRLCGGALVAGLLVSATPALAHAPVMGIGGVFGGFLHALLIPEHGMSLMALGLALGQKEFAARRLTGLIFLGALTVGLVATLVAAEWILAGDVLLAATGVLGLLVAVGWMPPVIGWPLAAVVGLMFALDSRPEVTATDEFVRMLIGSGIGAVLALALVAQGSSPLQGNVSRTAVRVLGSWITAIAVLDLALRVATRFATA